MSILTQTPLGARPVEPGVAELRVLALLVGSVAVRIGGKRHALLEQGDGFWVGEAPKRVNFGNETVELEA